VISRVPDEVITIDDLEEGEWTDDEAVEDRAYKNIQELKISEVATGLILAANRYKAHLDGGSQASTMNDKSVLWGFKRYMKKNPCRVRLMCADGKNPIVPVSLKNCWQVPGHYHLLTDTTLTSTCQTSLTSPHNTKGTGFSMSLQPGKGLRDNKPTMKAFKLSP